MIDILRDLIKLIQKLIGKESPDIPISVPLPPKPLPDPPTPPKPKPPKPKPDSPYFDFFGKQRFLVFVSYFDGIRARHLLKDLDYLKRKGVDGIRLYLNFSYPPNRPWDFLFQPNGSLHAGRLEMLHTILKLTRKKQMVVDLSSSRRKDPDGWQMPINTYARCWGLLAKQLKDWGFEHFLIDIENEHNNPWAGQAHTMMQGEARAVRKAIQAHLPDALITASVASHISPESAVNWAEKEGMNWIGYHDPRVRTWPEDTEGLALRCKRAVGSNKIKIYFQEPNGINPGGSAQSTNEFRVALAGAKRAKIAGWCFHTGAGFTLSDGSFESKLKPAEREFLENL